MPILFFKDNDLIFQEIVLKEEVQTSKFDASNIALWKQELVSSLTQTISTIS